MKKNRYTEEQIIGLLKQHEAGVTSTERRPMGPCRVVRRRSACSSARCLTLWSGLRNWTSSMGAIAT
jgi:hypothetical protein